MWKALLFALLLTGTNSPAIEIPGLDTAWKQTGAATWKRSVGGLGGSADISIMVLGGVLWYRVDLPCADEGKKSSIIWRSGDAYGTERSCEETFTITDEDEPEAWEHTADAIPEGAQKLMGRRSMRMAPEGFRHKRI